MKKYIRWKEKESRKKQNEELEQLKRSDIRRYWMKLKAFLGLGKGEQNLPSELLIKNELVEGEAAKRAWRDAFQKLGEVNEKDSDFDEQFLKECKDQIENWIEQKQESIELDREIGREEVLRAVKALKAGKAAGYDGITGER